MMGFTKLTDSWEVGGEGGGGGEGERHLGM